MFQNLNKVSCKKISRHRERRIGQVDARHDREKEQKILYVA